MAQKLGDVVFRRTDLGTGAHPGAAALRICAHVMARELGWDEPRMRQELKEVETAFPRPARASQHSPASQAVS
jgi:glycerol-3-phosphate dehydrogenase